MSHPVDLWPMHVILMTYHATLSHPDDLAVSSGWLAYAVCHPDGIRRNPKLSGHSNHDDIAIVIPREFLLPGHSIGWSCNLMLTYLSLDKMAAISQTTFSILMNENSCILMHISLKLAPEGLIDNNSALVSMMAWRLIGDKPLSEPMPIDLLMHICGAMGRWVNILSLYKMADILQTTFQMHFLQWNLLYLGKNFNEVCFNGSNCELFVSSEMASPNMREAITWTNVYHAPYGAARQQWFNTLRPRQNGRRFADDTFKRIFLNENVRISIKISLKFVPKGPINNIPALVQIMAWRRSGDKPLSEPMMVSLLTHICVTRPQWVNFMCGHQ